MKRADCYLEEAYASFSYGRVPLCLGTLIVLAYLVFCAATPSVNAAFPEENLDKAQQKGLAHHPIWLKLLHYGKAADVSEVLSDQFFLSPNGRSDPSAELIATLEAYAEPWQEDPDAHPRCRFPARYYWLSQHVQLPGYKVRNRQCKRLEKWALLDRVESVSLLLVSGYLGNPASTFGHSLLKLNTDYSDDQSGLFDLSINYGALIPENEATWRYVYRGITGGYQAGFSDKYFYTQDLVYSRKQFRDIWDYELALSDSGRILLVLHIWEILGQKFRYYFLDKNCAYRLAELLEIAIDEPLLQHASAWYAPVETFHRLNDINTVRIEEGRPGLIETIRFIPSSQRRLFHQLSRLGDREVEAVKTITEESPPAIQAQLSPFAQERQLEILDAALAYHDYRRIAEEPTPSKERLALKDQTLLARLRLPPKSEPVPNVPVIRSPAGGNRPMLMGMGIGNETNEGTYLRLHWSPFAEESIGQNDIEGDELAALDTVFGIGGQDHDLFIERMDLIRIRTLKTTFIAMDDESPWSWRLRVGAELTEQKGEPKYDGVLSFGTGRAWKLRDSVLFYAMADVDAHTLYPYARLRPQIGMEIDRGSVKSGGYAGIETVDYRGKYQEVWGAHIQIGLSHRLSLLIEVNSGTTGRASAEIRWFR